MPLIPFPNVPNVPGVPPLPRLPGKVNRAATNVQTALASVALLLAGQNATQWGIYDDEGQLIGQTSNGTSVKVTGLITAAQKYLEHSSDAGPFTLAFDYRKETVISEFPIEEGSFAAFNKVERPGNPIVTLIASGTEEQRATFLDAVDSACKSTDKLYSVVTPEFVYYNHSIESYSYQRTNARGANVLIVELALKEIRTVTASFNKATAPATAPVNQPQSASAAPATNSGMVQATAPPKSALKAAYDKLSGLSGGK